MEIFLASCFWCLEFSPSRPYLVFLPSRETFPIFFRARALSFRFFSACSADMLQVCPDFTLTSAYRPKHGTLGGGSGGTTPMFTSGRGLKTNMWTFFTSLACIRCSCCWERNKWTAGMMGWWDDRGGAAKHVPLGALQNTRSRLAQLRIIFHGALC